MHTGGDEFDKLIHFQGICLASASNRVCCNYTSNFIAPVRPIYDKIYIPVSLGMLTMLQVAIGLSLLGIKLISK
jgi:hypothetical protein